VITSTQRLGCLALTIALAPGMARAQAPADSFETLQLKVQPGQPVVVTDTMGRQAKGRLEKLSPSSLMVAGRTFTEPTVRQIRLRDPLWNGALIGAAIGTSLAVWDYTIDPSEPGNAAIFAVAVTVGTAAGAGLDALRSGRVIYAARRPRVVVRPLLEKGRRGALIAVRF
jgi:hypothetical protein